MVGCEAPGGGEHLPGPNLNLVKELSVPLMNYSPRSLHTRSCVVIIHYRECHTYICVADFYYFALWTAGKCKVFDSRIPSSYLLHSKDRGFIVE